jgi:cytidylate kinase
MKFLRNINLRDGQDISRKNSPLTVASDSIVINTDDISLDQLENKLFSHVTPLLSKK